MNGRTTRRAAAAGMCEALAFAGLPLVVLAGCSPWVGPISLRIETGGIPVADFVVEPGLVKGLGHHGELTLLEPQVASSGSRITIPRLARDPLISSVRVTAYHPLYAAAWTGAAVSAAMDLPPILPETWRAILERDGPISYARTAQHLLQIRERWIPAFPAEQRTRLADYLPALRELADGAQLLSGDLSRFETEQSARRHLAEHLEAMTELLR